MFDCSLCINRWRDLIEQTCEVTHFYFITCTFYSTTFRVPQYHDKLGAGNFAGVFQATQYVIRNNCTSQADTKDVSQSLVKNQFCRSAGIHTAYDGSHWPLSVAG